MFISKNNCPVPFNQQPLNEYLALKKSLLFSWSISPNKSFLSGLFVFFLSLFVFFSLLLVLIIHLKSVVYCLLLTLLLCNLVMFLLFLRLYLGWSYIAKRLFSAIIFYEESGWYDGQSWIKTSNYLMQDRLIGKYQVMPFINRIKLIVCVLCINFVFIFLFMLIY